MLRRRGLGGASAISFVYVGPDDLVRVTRVSWITNLAEQVGAREVCESDAQARVVLRVIAVRPEGLLRLLVALARAVRVRPCGGIERKLGVSSADEDKVMLPLRVHHLARDLAPERRLGFDVPHHVLVLVVVDLGAKPVLFPSLLSDL